MSDELLSGVFLKAVCIVALFIFWIGLGITLYFKYFWR